ncbi:MAG TPA: hydroxyphenylacetyl-CoA thioesterase PaaI [Puia sp.]|jgi:acyl-CoA thioesterase|nr:hydroxyphenylacetyl-CoA thioesterase PaaI [Puia sp.]
MERPELSPREVLEIMLKKDRFTALLGLVVDEIGPGHCKLHFRVTDEMLNGFDILHGGVLFSASDSALAFACNSYGKLTVALDVSISFTRPGKAGELLTVEAKEAHLGNRIGIYDIRTTNENGELLSLFKGTTYRTGKPVE